MKYMSSSILPSERDLIIWSDHALRRVHQRSIGIEAVQHVLLHPHKIFATRDNGTKKFIGIVGGRKLHVIAAPTKEKQWVIVSVWVRGEDDPRSWFEDVIGSVIERVLQRIKRW
jgi:hypothetical protein